jgi:hypothetical protein
VRAVIFSLPRQGRFTKVSFNGGKAAGASNCLISSYSANVKNAYSHVFIIFRDDIAIILVIIVINRGEANLNLVLMYTSLFS